jgi:hypothetical protein
MATMVEDTMRVAWTDMGNREKAMIWKAMIRMMMSIIKFPLLKVKIPMTMLP